MNPSPSEADLPATGLIVLRASRLEALVEPLDTLLRAVPPAEPLAPQFVVAAQPGVRDWLAMALARRRGPAGVLANVEFLLPWQWVESCLWGPDEATLRRRWTRTALIWRIEALLRDPGAIVGLDFAPLNDYLGGAGSSPAALARRRLQLAERLAGLLSRWLVYRPDWLEAWQRGADPLPQQPASAGLYGPLWRTLVAIHGEAHRVQRLRARLRADRRIEDGQGDQPLHLFGLAHLPPPEFALLERVAEQRCVLLYVPDPCREYWLGLEQAPLRGVQDPYSALAECAAEERGRLAALGRPPALSASAHPLLAAWGRMGQHFVMALAGLQRVARDLRHHGDAEPALPAHRLARLQQGIRELRPELAAEDLAGPAQWARARLDASLRAHACHTRLRELEVLRDALLDALSADATLHPADIVVMAPDIGAYVPFLAAVFGPPGDAEARLPWHLHDAPVAASHRVFSLFQRLLALPGERLSAATVLDLVSVDECAGALGLDAEALALLRDWLAGSRIAWGLDGDHRARFEVPALDLQTFAWGLDRMLAGYVLEDAPNSEAQQVLQLPDGARLLPLRGIGAPQAEVLGALDSLLRCLAQWIDAASAGPQPASVWLERIEALLDALLRVDRADRQAERAEIVLHQLLRRLVDEPAQAAVDGERFDPELDYAVVRERLELALTELPAEQRLLLGGITFCGMVPQRAVPFRFVAVLGLNEGEFPRGGPEGNLDLAALHPRIGDRDARSDDRYLFLETLMSARDRLHLSWIGEGVQDGQPRNPAAPLAELLAELDRHADFGEAPPADPRQRPWIVVHPLHPFDARCFDGSDPALASFDARAAALAAPSAQTAFALAPDSATVPAAAPAAEAGEIAGPLELELLRRWLKRPAQALLRDRLKLALSRLEDQALLDSELLDGALEPQQALARRQFLEELGRRVETGRWPELPEHPPERLLAAGLAPPGPPAQAAWQRERAAVAALRQTFDRALDDLAAVHGSLEGLRPTALDIAPEQVGLPLQGRIGGLLLSTGGASGSRLALLPAALPKPGADPPLKALADLHFGERLPLFVDWALAQLALGPDYVVYLLLLGKPGTGRAWDAKLSAWSRRLVRADAAERAWRLEQLRDRLRELLDLRALLMASGQPGYLPRSSTEAAQATKAEPLALELLWERIEGRLYGTDERPGEIAHDAGYTRLLLGRRGLDPDWDEAGLQAFCEVAQRLQACMELDADDAVDAAQEGAG